MLAPDSVMERVFETLCVCSFDGISAAELWPTVESQLGTEIDTFTRQVVWSWIVKDQRFHIGAYQDPNDLGAKGRKQELVKADPDLPVEDIIALNLTLKVDDDIQSMYLTGVKANDNLLGKMPYELLRVIAKHRFKGINSLDLIKESGQDSRSLTNRLQVLESSQLIVKMGVSAGKHSTNHMYHFRFIKSNTVVIADEVNSNDRYDRYLVITQTMEILKSAPKEMRVRLTMDLFEELRVVQSGLKLRWFNCILRFLVSYGYAELIQVEHGQKKRLFPAVRYLKDLPASSTKTELMNKIKEQEKLDEDEGVIDTNLEGSFVDDPAPQLNRFLPLVNQIRNFISQNQECMISDVENRMLSIYKTKLITHFIDNMICTNDKNAKPGYIIGEMIYMGKVKMYKLMTFDYWNKNNIENGKDIGQTDLKFEIRGLNDKPLIEINSQYLRNFSFDRRVQILELIDPDSNDLKTFMIWKLKKNNSLKPVTDKSSLFEGQINSSNGLIELQLAKNDIKITDVKKDLYTDQMKKIIKYVNNSNKLNEITEFELPIETITVKDGSDNLLPTPASTPVDLGPNRRREALLNEVNEKKCVCICVEFCSQLSNKLNLDYIIDRRTLMRDAAHLESKGKVTTDKWDGKKFIIKSVINEPTYDDIMLAIKEPTKKTKTARVFTDKVSFDEVVLFDENNLKRGLKFPDKESRLKNATDRNKGFIPETGRIVRRRKRKRKIDESIGDEGHDDDNDSLEENYDQKDIQDESDLIGPMMDKRKRKKFKPSTKQQARVARAFKKMRSSVKMKEDHILLFIKAVLITQSLNPSATIDWPKVASVFDESYGSETLRRMWPRYKKLLGVKNVTQARKNWETVLLSAVESKTVKNSDLVDYDVFKMLDLWKVYGTELFMSKSQMVIAKNYQDNFKGHHFEALKEDVGVDVYKEPPSLIEKEQAWTMRSFTYPINQESRPNEIYKQQSTSPSLLQQAKIKLKALFATPIQKFSGALVKKLFENIPKEVYAKALTDLEDSKAIAFLGEDSNIKFTLTDKVMTVLECKLTPEFIASSMNFENLVSNEIDTSHTGILLSAKSPVAVYAPLFNYIAQNAITVTRIDQKPMSLDSYSTKSRDRSKLESDFLLSHFNKFNIQDIKEIKPSSGTPCSAIWIDLKGDFNPGLWKKCVCFIIWEILFHPGTKIGPLCRRAQPLLEPSEVKLIVDWMKQRKCINEEDDCYWATYNWYHLF